MRSVQDGPCLHLDDGTQSFLAETLRLKGDLTLTVDETSPPTAVNAQQVLYSGTPPSNCCALTCHEPDVRCSLTCHSDSAVSQSEFEYAIAQLCALPLQRIRQLWRMYMTAFAEQLLRWQGNAQSPAALRLVSLQETVRSTFECPSELRFCTVPMM